MNISLASFLRTAFFAFFFANALIGSAFAAKLKSSPIAVLELFTSQGCSSSPAADALLAKLGKRDDIIALAYHVDYWDYIGWKDSFASRENSELQIAYAKVQKARHVYTPQLIINGSIDVVGSRAEKIEKILANAHLFVPIELKYDDEYLKISIPADESLSEAMIWLVNFSSNRKVKISKGENSGKILTYSNIVNDRRALGMWNPKSGLTIKLPMAEIFHPKDDGIVIIVQEDINSLPGRIFGAVSLVR